MKINRLNSTAMLLVAALLLLASSCGSTKDVTYFQDLKPGNTIAVTAEAVAVTVRPDDKISIIVNSRDPQLTALFNLPIANKQIGQISEIQQGNNQGISGYTVDANGEIDFPVLGKIYVAGKTRTQIAEYIKEELVRDNLVKDPVVTVEFMNLCVAVLGEVNTPGRYAIERDRTTILDVLSQAGDLTIYGNRTNVMLLRKDGGIQRIYTLDLTSGNNIYSSPAYYVQQNDVVYVEPNSVRARQSTVNGNNVRSTAFWISLASLLTSVAILVFN